MTRKFPLMLLLVVGLLLNPTSAKDEPTRLDISPQLMNFQQLDLDMSVSTGFAEIGSIQFQSGSRYHHVVEVTLSDDINQRFGDDYYKLVFKPSGIGTAMLLPSQEVVIEDGASESLLLDFSSQLEESVTIELVVSIVAVRNMTAIVTTAIDISTYRMNEQDIEPGSQEYLLTSVPTRTEFRGADSFIWHYLPASYLFLPSELLIGTNYLIELEVHLDPGTVTDGGDRLRLEVNGVGKSMRLEDIEATGAIAIELEIDSIYNLQFATLSEGFSFNVTEVIINIPQELQDGQLEINLPNAGLYIGIVLLINPSMIVYGFNAHRQKVREELV